MKKSIVIALSAMALIGCGGGGGGSDSTPAEPKEDLACIANLIYVDLHGTPITKTKCWDIAENLTDDELKAKCSKLGDEWKSHTFIKGHLTTFGTDISCQVAKDTGIID